jgi:small-conductance mechanosensitive channel
MRWIAHLLIAALVAGLPLAGLAQGDAAQPAPAQQAESGTGFALPADGGAESPDLMLGRWDAEAALIEQVLADHDLNWAEIEGMRVALDAQRGAVPKIVAEVETRLKPLRDQRKALGDPPEDGSAEAHEIVAERARLAERIAAIEALELRATQADARAAALLAELSDLRRELFTRQFMTRGPSIFGAGAAGQALASVTKVAAEIRAETSERIAGAVLDARFLVRMLLTLLLIAGALFLVLRVKRAALRRLMPVAGAPSRAGALAGLSVTLVRLLMSGTALAMTAFALWNSGFLGPRGELLLGGIAQTVMAVIAAYALGGAYYAPHIPQYRLSRLGDEDAIAASRWLMALAAVMGLDLAFVVNGHQLGLSLAALDFLNTALICGGAVALWAFAGYLRIAPPEPAPKAAEEDPDVPAEEVPERAIGPTLSSAAAIIARAVAVVSPALSLMGFFVAAHFVFYPMVQSGAVIGACVLLFSRVQDMIDRLSQPDEAAAGEGAETAPSRIQLIPVLVGFLLICAATPVLALIWGADLTDLSSAWRLVAEGFEVGEITISPVDFFWFLLVFSVGYVVTRLVQGVLSRSVLPVTGLDAGGRAAVRAGVGYVGVTLAALAAISATGLDLSNLAIVAGALSVGIGFGLQNIVNNFVSGIILLIERPIKAGDWVELGSGTGYVKRINVRSTEIQTFDRASLIVPNSELISGPVTNWTHTDLNGRIIVPVGVAYSADPRQVETILTEIAKAHPQLLRRPAPYVLFRRFGADALEFEIRGVLRDVNWILNVTSDINFEISRRFAQAGIEVPFAQRDLHLRNAGELGRSIASAIRGEDGDPPPAAGGDTAEPAPRRRRRRNTEAAGNDSDGDT